MRRRPLILFLALLSVFLWGLPSARAASRWAPSSEKDARQKALDLFCECAFHAEYLLRFKNPLEVVSDSWQSMNGSGTVVDDEMFHILWELRDKQSAEFDYEMEPEYYEQPTPSSPEMTQQTSM